MKTNYDKEDCYKSLENINSWINNSDTKASIMLGIMGVIITVILTNNDLISKCTNIFDKVINNINLCDTLYIISVIGSFAFIIVGMYWLFKVLYPTLKKQMGSSKASHLYFGSIANFKDSKSFQKSINEVSEKEIIEDILDQIYINSVICTDKFNSFKKGLKYSVLGIGAISILFFIGITIYL